MINSPPHSIRKENIQLKINENSLDNYPNPFNPSTVIRYQVVNPGHVLLTVYNSLGQQVAKLVDKQQSSGSYEVNFRAENLASGIYLYRIVANDFTAVKKMILTK
ncbi:MAG TPA: T9SS type A sorting domain-containing protein [Bacteroidales bacterium]|nr:T9SS type A sorting domain-containing protein [Bacteroidales bacterium]